MINILNSDQIHVLELATLNRNNISSHQLMELAAIAFSKCFYELVPNNDESIVVLCGTGNNGGDGLAIARILYNSGYLNVAVFIFRVGTQESSNFSTNLHLLQKTPVPIKRWEEREFVNSNGSIIIDALLGIGLNRTLDGELLDLVNNVNRLDKHVIAVDIPTGMASEGGLKPNAPVMRAKEVVSFQLPKLSFFFPESKNVFERFIVVEIGLDGGFPENSYSNYSLIEKSDIHRIYKKRDAFSHKGTYGKALIIAGDTNTLGAALLCAEACLHTGAGLTSACIPHESLLALTIRSPEVMYVNENELESRWDEFNAIGIGPGLGKRGELLRKILTWKNKPLLLDADALNELANHRLDLARLPENTIITPHMKEFDRLFGMSTSWWARLQLAREKAHEHQIVIVLKNRYTFIILPNKKVLINPTGNPAMASGGMGDVLSGMITAFLAQGYAAEEAAVLGCYLHGKAGDVLVAEGMGVIPATVLSAKIPFVLKEFS